MQEQIDRLERDITLLSRAIAFPETPSLAGRVRSQIEAERRPQAPAPSWQVAVTAIAAAAVALAFVAGVFSPARDAVADLFDRINIFETAEVPADLTLEISGTQVTLAEAERRLGVPLLLPAEAASAEPDRVLIQDFRSVKAAVLFYRHSDGTPYALFETNAPVGKGLPIAGKGVLSSSQAQPVRGLGDEAYWLTGLRIVQYYDPSGAVIRDSVRATEANTLLWSDNGRVFRIEGDVTQEQALAIARSLRPRAGAIVPSPTAGPLCGALPQGWRPFFAPDPPVAGRPAKIRFPGESVSCTPPAGAPQKTVVLVDIYRAGDKPPAYIDPTNPDRTNAPPDARLELVAAGLYEGEIVFPEAGDWFLVFRDEAGSVADSRSVFAGIFIPKWFLGPATGSSPIRVLSPE